MSTIELVTATSFEKLLHLKANRLKFGWFVTKPISSVSNVQYEKTNT